MHLYLSLGTNLGDREANIKAALAMLDGAFGKGYERISDIVESEAWGFDGPDFLDLAVMYDVCLPAETVLQVCKAAERSMGRADAPEYDAQGRRIYRSRPIDIDILLYGDVRMDTPELSIPHPLIALRPFIEGPLRQILDMADASMLDGNPGRTGDRRERTDEKIQNV